MPKYRYEGKFKCTRCGGTMKKKGACRPKQCSTCGTGHEALELIEKRAL